MKYRKLKEKYPKFVYEKYFWQIFNNSLEIFFDFKIEPGIRFRPKIIIKNVDKSQIAKIGNRVLNNLVFNLGLMEIPSYWKATCSPEIEIQAGYLNQEQNKWWKDLIIKGMGQFFYENKINFRKPNFLKINVTGSVPVTLSNKEKWLSESKILVPVGGGKDSVVTLELFKKARKDVQCFSLNPTDAAEKIMKIADCKSPIIIKRTIDKKLLELNRKGFLNGHTPFSAYLAFLSVLVAAIFGQKFVVFSNERSSNEGNVKYLGEIINHQWAKSSEFEKMFRQYSKKYLTPHQKSGGGLEYFSFLRPLYEIQIARLFSKYPKYFPAFLSCNVVVAKKLKKRWCGSCPKCLFVYATLYPFLEKEQMLQIFGRDIFENKGLLKTMKELLGQKGHKPFECVGTKKESLIAFYLSWKKYTGSTRANLPNLLEYFQKKILPKYPNFDRESIKILNSWNNQHNLPKEFEKILRTSLSEKL